MSWRFYKLSETGDGLLVDYRTSDSASARFLTPDNAKFIARLKAKAKS